MEPEQENLRFYICPRIKLGDHENPTGIGICVWNIFLFIWHCLPGHPTFSKRQERPLRWAMVWSTKHCHERECHRAGEACYSTWPTYLNSGNNWNLLYYLLHGIIHRIIHEELGMKKVCTGAHRMETVRCAKQMIAMFEPQGPKRLTDAVTGDESFISFYGKPSKQVWLGSIKPGTNQPSSDMDFRTQTGSSLYLSTTMDPWWSTFCPRGQQWPVATTQEPLLPKVVAAAQEQRPNVGTTRTLLLHDNAAPHKARATQFWREKSDKSYPNHPTALT